MYIYILYNSQFLWLTPVLVDWMVPSLPNFAETRGRGVASGGTVPSGA